MRNKRILIFGCVAVLLGYIALAISTNITVRVMAENKTLPTSVNVIIDPGHGGEDGGAVSVHGDLESGLNLEISTRLQDLLRFLGYHTVMTRMNDESVHTEGVTIAQRKASDLRNRVQMINQTENPLLISIHQNYFTDRRYDGAQVFYADTNSSRALAEQVQRSFLTTINPGSNRMAKKADSIFLMEHIQCDGILIECGFLSNYREAQLLCEADYQKKLTAVIASAVSIYLESTPLLT